MTICSICTTWVEVMVTSSLNFATGMNSDFAVQKLIPPFRFAIVEEGVFRGAYPTERNCRFLRRLKLKTIVSLTPKKSNKVISGFCEQEGIINRHFPVPKFKDDVTITSTQVVHILQMVIDPDNLPIYIHCLDGSNITGIVTMCLRKLQNWNLSTIFTEFSRFTRANYISSVESEFVETFKAEIEIGSRIPAWLWQGERCTKHPTLKLKLLSPLEYPQATTGEKKKENRIRTQFESGAFSQSNKDFSRDLQALHLEGLSENNYNSTQP